MVRTVLIAFLLTMLMQPMCVLANSSVLIQERVVLQCQIKTLMVLNSEGEIRNLSEELGDAFEKRPEGVSNADFSLIIHTDRVEFVDADTGYVNEWLVRDRTEEITSYSTPLIWTSMQTVEDDMLRSEEVTAISTSNFVAPLLVTTLQAYWVAEDASGTITYSSFCQ